MTDRQTLPKSTETRAIGRYAVTRTYLREHFGFKNRKFKKKSDSDQVSSKYSSDNISKSSESTDDKNKSKNGEQSSQKKETGSENSSSTSDAQDKSTEGSKDDGKDELEKLKEVVEESQTTLCYAKAVWPFNFFPDEITVDRHKLTIIYHQFFAVAHTVSVDIKNISNIEAETGPFFGSLTVTSEHFVNNTREIHYLWRKDAVKLLKLVQGAIVANKEEIDVSDIEKKELIKLLIRLGEGHPSDKQKNNKY
jgi:hypothetical protein